ncbi:type V toxin-antitoxin system endoribonuclease antitoxin GhoS [Vibrio parahaemolyticus]|nr:type V toxin-antitoxin system endoribonuclease antitoxin GhoS [Vibrio parahaemolyticus]
MASFTVRIVLHDADWEDYNKLYEEMNKEGFSDEISSNDGTAYELPDGEYTISGNLTKSDVLSKAKNAASKTGEKYAVLVTQSSGRTWYGLKKV